MNIIQRMKIERSIEKNYILKPFIYNILNSNRIHFNKYSTNHHLYIYELAKCIYVWHRNGDNYVLF